MELHLLNTLQGLIPCTDDDYDEKKRLKLGQTYKATIKIARNYKFHRKYFAMIKCAWEYLSEQQVEYFRGNIEGFRKTMQVAAGISEPVYSIELKQWVEVPKSISFDQMDEIEFQAVYDNVLGVVLKSALKNISEDEFMQNVVNFL